MKTILSPAAMQAESLAWRREGRRIGLAPTMGFLHEGHLSLVDRARERADVVAVSIFVNALQFGLGEDYDTYPRDAERDLALCARRGVDVVFMPSQADLYASGHSVYVEETDLSAGLCGLSRPGHFRGVTTVVAKLFHLVLPDVAVFGLKDAQQARIIERMVRDLNFPTEIVIAPIVREPDGLAMSSRNTRLSTEDRARAVCLYRSLCLAERLYAEGITEAGRIRREMRETLRAAQADTDYVATVDYRSLHPVEEIRDETLVAVAARVGGVRLIDNTVIGGAA